MLSLEAFLSLYESTKEARWLERAQAAANFAESWIWIWNLPMPLDADDAQLHWKKGVPTIGLQGITALGAGGADEYLDWAVPSYAKLYNYTKDPHYLDVARVLLHDTKSMVALPGRQYDMKGIGWQQEGWRMGPGETAAASAVTASGCPGCPPTTCTASRGSRSTTRRCSRRCPSRHPLQACGEPRLAGRPRSAPWRWEVGDANDALHPVGDSPVRLGAGAAGQRQSRLQPAEEHPEPRSLQRAARLAGRAGRPDGHLPAQGARGPEGRRSRAWPS